MTAIYQRGDIFENKYELLDCLGSGGLGTVFKARQLDCDRILALKIWHALADEEDEKRFLREARVLSQLSDPNIVTIYNIGINDGVPYMAMELVEGRSLRQILAECNRLPTTRALRIIRDAALALAHVHSHNIVHRDIKPDNILLAEQPAPDTLKLIDFGLARPESANFSAQTDATQNSQNQNSASTLTQEGLLIGTPDYMSPEQCKGMRASHSSDIYSLSVCLFELITGHRLFGADSSIGLLYKHINDPVPQISPNDVENFHPLLNTILQKGLAKEERERYKSAKDFAAALNEILNELNSPDSSTVSGSRKTRGITPRLFGSAISIFVLLALITIYNSNNSEAAIKEALKLPKEQAFSRVLAILNKDLENRQDDRVLRQIKFVTSSNLLSLSERDEFRFRCFELFRERGKASAGAIKFATDELRRTLFSANRLATSSAQLPPTINNRIEAISHYLLDNPPDKIESRKILSDKDLKFFRDGHTCRIAECIQSAACKQLLAESTLKVSDRTRLAKQEAAQYYLDAARDAVRDHKSQLACSLVRRVIELSPGDYSIASSAHLLLSHAFANMSDFRKAKAELETAEQSAIKCNNTQELLEVYETAVELGRKQNDLKYCLDKALRLRATAENSGNAIPQRVAQSYLLKSYLKMGNIDGARKQIGEAQRILDESPAELCYFYFDACRAPELSDQTDLLKELCLLNLKLSKQRSSQPDIVRAKLAMATQILRTTKNSRTKDPSYQEVKTLLANTVEEAAKVYDFWLLRDLTEAKTELHTRLNDWKEVENDALYLLKVVEKDNGPIWVRREAINNLLRCSLHRNEPDAARKIILDAKKKLEPDQFEQVSFYYFAFDELRNIPDLEKLLYTKTKELLPLITDKRTACLADTLLIRCLCRMPATASECQPISQELQSLISDAAKFRDSEIEFWIYRDYYVECIKVAMSQNNWSRVEEFARKSLALAENYNDQNVMAETYVYLFRQQLRIKGPDAALALLLEAEKKLGHSPAFFKLLFETCKTWDYERHIKAWHELCQLHKHLARKFGQPLDVIRSDITMASCLLRENVLQSNESAGWQKAAPLLAESLSLTEKAKIDDAWIRKDIYLMYMQKSWHYQDWIGLTNYANKIFSLAADQRNFDICQEANNVMFEFLLKTKGSNEAREHLLRIKKEFGTDSHLCRFYFAASRSGLLAGHLDLKNELCKMNREFSSKFGTTSELARADCVMSECLRQQAEIANKKDKATLLQEAEQFIAEAEKLSLAGLDNEWKWIDLHNERLSLAMQANKNEKIKELMRSYLDSSLKLQQSWIYQEACMHLSGLYQNNHEPAKAHELLMEAKRNLKSFPPGQVYIHD